MRLASTLVESVALKPVDRRVQFAMTGDRRGIRLFDRRIEAVALHRLHRQHRSRIIGVQLEERQNGIEERRNRQAIRPDNTVVELMPREMRIGEDDLLTVTHPAHSREKFR